MWSPPAGRQLSVSPSRSDNDGIGMMVDASEITQSTQAHTHISHKVAAILSSEPASIPEALHLTVLDRYTSRQLWWACSERCPGYTER